MVLEEVSNYDPSFPFLGVHYTKRIDGEIEAGPNAVLAWAREGYEKTMVSPIDLAEILTFPGFWRMAWHVYDGPGSRTGSVRTAVF